MSIACYHFYLKFCSASFPCRREGGAALFRSCRDNIDPGRICSHIVLRQRSGILRPYRRRNNICLRFFRYGNNLCFICLFILVGRKSDPAGIYRKIAGRPGFPIVCADKRSAYCFPSVPESKCSASEADIRVFRIHDATSLAFFTCKADEYFRTSHVFTLRGRLSYFRKH